MKVSDKGGGVDFEPAPSGNHVARCYMMIDLGTTHNAMYDTWQHKLYLAFELPNETRTWKDGEGHDKSAPFTVGAFYTASLSSKANLRKDLESWRGRPFTPEERKGFEMKNIIGKPAMVNVIHTPREGKKPRADISSISSMPKGMECPKAVHDPVYFSFEEFSKEALESVPEGFQKIIKTSKEWQEIVNPTPQKPGIVDDDMSALDDIIDEDSVPF